MANVQHWAKRILACGSRLISQPVAIIKELKNKAGNFCNKVSQHRTLLRDVLIRPYRGSP
jgi:hypothetical protein